MNMTDIHPTQPVSTFPPSYHIKGSFPPVISVLSIWSLESTHAGMDDTYGKAPLSAHYLKFIFNQDKKGMQNEFNLVIVH